MFFPSQRQPPLIRCGINNTEDNSLGTEDNSSSTEDSSPSTEDNSPSTEYNSPGTEVTPASDSNGTSVIIGSVLGSLAVLLLSAILVLLLIPVLRKKRRHCYTIQGMPYVTV